MGPTVRVAYKGAGGTANCPHFDDRPFVSPKILKHEQLHPQDEGLF